VAARVSMYPILMVFPILGCHLITFIDLDTQCLIYGQFHYMKVAIMKNHIQYPDQRDLVYFEKIARVQSLSRAAERLGVGQPGLSLVVKRLEEVIGVPLFIRQNRGLLLTRAGQRLLSRCGRLQEEWSLLLSATKNEELALKGKFRLGCHTTVAHYCLNPFVKDFYTQYPEIDFELRHGLSRQVCESVISANVDFAFVINPVRHPDLIIKSLAKDEVGFWGVDQHLPDVLIFDPELQQSQALIKKSGHKFKRYVRSSSLEVVASLAESGAGVAILPERVAKSLAPSTMKIRTKETFQDEITFVYRFDLPKTAAATAVLEAVKRMRI
jgi:DNA-binding transcriptional LysR family regulator